MKEHPAAIARLKGAEVEYLSEALPAIEKIIEDEKAAVIRRVGELTRTGELTGERAIQLWMQFRAADLLYDRTVSRIKMAQAQLTTASRTASIVMNGDQTRNP